MGLVNTETGEIVEPLSRPDAERLTTRIRLRLDTIADNYVAVMPLIREAIQRQAFAARQDKKGRTFRRCLICERAATRRNDKRRASA